MNRAFIARWTRMPRSIAIERVGAITSQPVLGGLHHQYCRILIFGTHSALMLALSSGQLAK